MTSPDGSAGILSAENEQRFMREALDLSLRAFPAPNPKVGAVIVKEGKVVGRGFHFGVGHAHAEVVALREAGEYAKGADMYVTLEPCNHEGRTPACSMQIAAAGIRRVVFPVADPNPVAQGGGKMLREAGIVVESGPLADEAEEINRVFLYRYRTGKPYVIVKAAVTLDGRIATASGESKWITGEEARRRAQELRAETGCVLVGAGTVRCDDPELTVRGFEVAGQPLRVVLGSVDPGRQILDESVAETVVFERRTPTPTLPLEGGGSASEPTPTLPLESASEVELDIGDVLDDLAARSVIGVLVEGGARTIESFFRQGFVNEVELHVAPKVLGSGPVWADGPGVGRLRDAWKLSALRAEPLGDGLRITARVGVPQPEAG